MITGIEIENFKGVRDRVRLELRPITLLFGANSAGKSTFFHALHYAREIFERRNLDADQTISGGDYIDLGGFENFVHGRDRNKAVKLRIDVALDRHGFPSFDADFDFMARVLVLHFDSFLTKAESAAVELTIEREPIEENLFVSSTAIFIDNTLFAKITARDSNGSAITHLTLDHPSLLSVHEASLAIDRDLLTPRHSVLKEALANCGELATNEGNAVSIPLLGRGDALPNFNHTLPFTDVPDEHFDQVIYPDAVDESDVEFKMGRELMIALSDLIIGPCQLIHDQLKQFRYLGPLRETPERTYSPPRFAEPSRWSSGLGAWDALQNGSEEFVNRVGSWLGDDDKLNSGYRVERKSYKEIALSDPRFTKLMSGRAFDELDETLDLDLMSLDQKSRIVIVPSESDIELRPHDVGIGISQVVPVVTTALDGRKRLLAIEQPELHLHPKVQAELGDLFIEAALGDSKHVIILETHSELIPLRLMRRIRECQAKDASGRQHLTADHVAIYYVDKHEGRTTAELLELSSDGGLLDPWPDGFFEEGFREQFGE